MSFVVSFTDYRPIRRYPPITTPWTRARIEEATAEGGPWTTVDTITLSPVDADPTDPLSRSFSTSNATLPVGWYRVVWLDAAGNEDITDPRLHPAGGGATGQPYFTVEEFRDRYPELATDESVATYPDEKVEEARAIAEQAIEDLCGPFVPRTVTGVVLDDPVVWTRRGRQVPFNDVTAITAAVDRDGATIDITGLRLTHGWAKLPTAAWPTGPVTVTLTRGRTLLPLRVKQAAMALTKQWMILGPITARETQLATEQGGVINMASPGRFGSYFGLPEVDAVIQIYANRAVRLA